MTKARLIASLLLPLVAVAARAGEDPAGPGHNTGVRAVADVMSQPPLVAIENSLRAWAVEKSEDFGVVLIEVLGQIPLHMHPDGNRRMFVVEGRKCSGARATSSDSTPRRRCGGTGTRQSQPSR